MTVIEHTHLHVALGGKKSAAAIGEVHHRDMLAVHLLDLRLDELGIGLEGVDKKESVCVTGQHAHCTHCRQKHGTLAKEVNWSSLKWWAQLSNI